jgi:hypothetical protein
VKDNVIVVEDTLHWKPNHVYAYDLKNKSSQRLTSNTKPLTSYTVSKDGKWLIYGIQRNISYAADSQLDPLQFLKNLDTGETVKILTGFEFPTYGFQFTNDNEGFYFSSGRGSDPKYNGPSIDELYYFNLQTKTHTKVNLDWDLGLSGAYYSVDVGILVSLANKATRRLVFYKKKGSTWLKQNLDLGDKNDHVAINAVSEDGTKVTYGYSTASTLPHYYIADVKNFKFKNESILVKLNKKLSKNNVKRLDNLLLCLIG